MSSILTNAINPIIIGHQLHIKIPIYTSGHHETTNDPILFKYRYTNTGRAYPVVSKARRQRGNDQSFWHKELGKLRHRLNSFTYVEALPGGIGCSVLVLSSSELFCISASVLFRSFGSVPSLTFETGRSSSSFAHLLFS